MKLVIVVFMSLWLTPLAHADTPRDEVMGNAVIVKRTYKIDFEACQRNHPDRRNFGDFCYVELSPLSDRNQIEEAVGLTRNLPGGTVIYVDGVGEACQGTRVEVRIDLYSNGYAIGLRDDYYTPGCIAERGEAFYVQRAIGTLPNQELSHHFVTYQ